MSKQKVLSFIVPVHNESETIIEILGKVKNLKLPYNFGKELVLVNDASTDNSLDLMKSFKEDNNLNVKVLDNEKNLGKTQTVRRGILESTGDFVVIQDGDLEYEPKDIASLLDKVINEGADFGYGDRFGEQNEVIYYQNYYGNKFLSFISNIFTYPRLGVYIPDMEVCYKMVKGEIIRDIAEGIESQSNFGLEPELTAKLSRYKIETKSNSKSRHLNMVVHPIKYYPRSIEEGKKMNAIKDGSKALLEILKFNIF